MRDLSSEQRAALGKYIKEALGAGNSRESIYQALLGQGWALKAIEECFNEAERRDEDKVDTQQRTIRIILMVGSVLVAAGIFSFVAANWQEIPKVLKLLLILAVMIGAYY